MSKNEFIFSIFFIMKEMKSTAPARVGVLVCACASMVLPPPVVRCGGHCTFMCRRRQSICYSPAVKVRWMEPRHEVRRILLAVLGAVGSVAAAVLLARAGSRGHAACWLLDACFSFPSPEWDPGISIVPYNMIISSVVL